MIIPGTMIGANSSGATLLSYTLLFNDTTDWVGETAPYTITVLGTVHAFVGEMFIEVWIKEADSYVKQSDTIDYNVSVGTTSKTVTLSTETKFNGKLVISGSKVPSELIPLASHEQAGIVTVGKGLTVKDGIVSLQDDENNGTPIIGRYVGDGNNTQEIELGFRPSFGIVFTIDQAIVRVQASNVVLFTAFIGPNGSTLGVDLTDTGFSAVYLPQSMGGCMTYMNAADIIYQYIVFR